MASSHHDRLSVKAKEWPKNSKRKGRSPGLLGAGNSGQLDSQRDQTNTPRYQTKRRRSLPLSRPSKLDSSYAALKRKQPTIVTRSSSKKRKSDESKKPFGPTESKICLRPKQRRRTLTVIEAPKSMKRFYLKVPAIPLGIANEMEFCLLSEDYQRRVYELSRLHGDDVKTALQFIFIPNSLDFRGYSTSEWSSDSFQTARSVVSEHGYGKETDTGNVTETNIPPYSQNQRPPQEKRDPRLLDSLDLDALDYPFLDLDEEDGLAFSGTAGPWQA